MGTGCETCDECDDGKTHDAKYDFECDPVITKIILENAFLQ